MKDETISRVMSMMGRKGGKVGGAKGGAKSWANMTPEERTARAKKMIAAREAKRAEKKGKP